MARKGPRSVLIIEARFYEDIADELARGATEELKSNQMTYERLSVPGSLEIALALSLALSAGQGGIAAASRSAVSSEARQPITTSWRENRPPACISSPCSMRCRSALVS
jgi:hypothetical protein